MCPLTDAAVPVLLASAAILHPMTLENPMATESTVRPAGAVLIGHVLAGTAAGVAGGVMFGMLMQMMGMIPMVAQLVGSDSSAVGWLVHLAISAFIGATYGILFARYAVRPAPAAVTGLLYGAAWWILGALILMPARLGMPTFTLNTTAWQSLMGHLLFGLILGLGYTTLHRSMARR